MKKIIKIVAYLLLTVVLVLLLGVGIGYYVYHSYEPQDNFTVKAQNIQYYHNTYTEGRKAFLSKAHALKQNFPSTTITKYKVPSAIDDNLTVDVCYIPGQDSTKLLLMSSGIHGVEGFVGSAMQSLFMEEYLTPELIKKCGVLFVHSVNPYGYKYIRRVTENNVDLNRNCDLFDSIYEYKNTGYMQVSEVINPEESLAINSFDSKLFFLTAIHAIKTIGMGPLRQGILQGQYHKANGLYFGGHHQEPQITALQPIIDSICSPYSTVLSLDLHTGYGARGVMHLFPNAADSITRAYTETIFDGMKIDWGDDEDFYMVTGDFTKFVGQLNQKTTYIPMTLEFGTMDSQTTLGSLHSINVMVLENQGAQYGYASAKDSIEVKRMIREMFYPESAGWRSKCVDEFREAMDVAVPKFLSVELK